jgi:hypothetical protein
MTYSRSIQTRRLPGAYGAPSAGAHPVASAVETIFAIIAEAMEGASDARNRYPLAD